MSYILLLIALLSCSSNLNATKYKNEEGRTSPSSPLLQRSHRRLTPMHPDQKIKLLDNRGTEYPISHKVMRHALEIKNMFDHNINDDTPFPCPSIPPTAMQRLVKRLELMIAQEENGVFPYVIETSLQALPLPLLLEDADAADYIGSPELFDIISHQIIHKIIEIDPSLEAIAHQICMISDPHLRSLIKKAFKNIMPWIKKEIINGVPSASDLEALLPDGIKIIIEEDRKKIQIWDTYSAKKIGELNHPAAIDSATLSPDGTHIIVGLKDATTHIWSQLVPETFEEALGLDEEGGISQISTPHLILEPESNQKELIPIIIIDPLGSISPANQHLHPDAVKFSTFITKVLVFNEQTGKKENTAITIAGFETCTVENMIYLLNLQAQEGVDAVRSHLLRVYSAIPLDQFLKQIIPETYLADYLEASALFNLLVEIINKKISTSNLTEERIASLIDSIKNKLISTALEKIHIKTIPWVTQIIFSNHGYPVTSVAFSPDGTKMVTASYRTAYLWDINRQTLITRLQGHNGMINLATFSFDGTRIITSSDDNTAALWDVDSQQVIGIIHDPYGINSIALSPDGTILVTGSDQGIAHLWNVNSQQKIGIPLKGHTLSIYSVAFSPDGTKIITGSSDKTACIWDVSSQQLIGKLEGHTDWVNAVAFSFDSTKIATGSWDGTVRIWDVATQKQIGIFSGHTQQTNSIAFSPDDKMIVTGSKSKTACIWDIDSLQQIGELNGPRGWVTAIAFSRDGTKIATGSLDTKAYVWHQANMTDFRNAMQLYHE